LGILQEDLNISEREAYLMLQRQSQQRRTAMRDIAEAVVLSNAVKQSGLPAFRT
jgi:uroporphyrinogen-III synthase